jgi:two-component system phosphate regulon sensor histidine kinase PhoR
MTGRLVAFLACVFGGAFLGWLLAPQRGVELGVFGGALGWFTVESLRALRVLGWLKRGTPETMPRVAGLWGEAADRMRRALIVRDRETEDAQRRLDDFLDAIRASPNGVVLLDAGGRIEWCNETAALQFGLDPSRDLQQHILNLVRDPDFSQYFNGRNFSADLVLAAPISTPARPMRVAVRLHPYAGGRLLLLSRDVTAVEQAETMRRDFVANVSHEIRTPLTVLTGFVETLQHLPLPAEEQSRYLALMAQQAQRMQTLVSDLLTLSRLEGSPLPGNSEWTPASQLLAQCEEEARGVQQALGKQLTLRIVPAPHVLLAGSPSEYTSAFSNLVSNAVRYTPAGGSVEVRAELLASGGFQFSVRDTGPGIAPEHLPRLTERFYRVDRSRSRETGGTGLGLAIVKHVVQRHGGELRIDSTPGAGSTFTIQFPASRVRPQGPVAAGTPARPATESAAG